MKHRSLHRFFRVLCVCAALCLFVLPVVAETFDLSSMTDAEVSALLEQVNQEIVGRGIFKSAKLPKGSYIAGKDIPTGAYIYTCLASGSDWGNVTVYSDGGKGKQLLWEVVMAPEAGQEPESFFVTLSDGDQLKSGVPFSLTVFGGIQFK